MKRSHNQRCHKNIHQGRLKVEGQASTGLRWSNRWGQTMTVFPGYRYPPRLTGWFDRELALID